MSAWEELAEQRKPKEKRVSLGEGLERFLQKTVGSFGGLRALLHLVEEAPKAVRTADAARAADVPKGEIVPVLERLAEAKVLERRSGLLGAKWAYQKDNPHAMAIYRLRKLWKHPRTHNLVVKLVMGKDGGA